MKPEQIQHSVFGLDCANPFPAADSGYERAAGAQDDMLVGNWNVLLSFYEASEETLLDQVDHLTSGMQRAWDVVSALHILVI